MKSVLLADPLELVAEGVRSWCAGTGALELVGHVSNGQALLNWMKTGTADIVLLEVSLPQMDGIDTMRAVHGLHPRQKVLAISALSDIEYVNSMLIEGACGYLVKDCSRDEFLHAVNAVLDGQRYLSQSAEESVRRGYRYTEKDPEGEYIGLTQREREIIRMVAQERTNGEISAALGITEDTVKSHRKKLMTKLNVRSTAGLVKYALDRRWA